MTDQTVSSARGISSRGASVLSARNGAVFASAVPISTSGSLTSQIRAWAINLQPNFAVFEDVETLVVGTGATVGSFALQNGGAKYRALESAEINPSRVWSELFDKWAAETNVYSSPLQIKDHRIYQLLLRHGDAVVETALAKLDETPMHSMLMLSAVTGENPVTEEMRGRIPNMINAWREWARNRENGT